MAETRFRPRPEPPASGVREIRGALSKLPQGPRDTLPWRQNGRHFGLMGVLNATPDSFYAESRVEGLAPAEKVAQRMAAEGVDVFDVGGESTRPGATPVPAREEERRVLAVIALLREAYPSIPVSIDTYKASVARSAVEAGATIVNDIGAGQLDPEMPSTVAALGTNVVLGHLRGTPATMRDAPPYDDVIADVRRELSQRVEVYLAAGVAEDRIWLDPGIGFGKKADDSRTLLFGLEGLRDLGRPLVIGLSRKSFLADALARDGLRSEAGDDRLEASIAAAVLAAERGADLIRVHDVGPTRRALALLEAGLGSR
jgi:dihydropteroate synthase